MRQFIERIILGGRVFNRFLRFGFLLIGALLFQTLDASAQSEQDDADSQKSSRRHR